MNPNDAISDRYINAGDPGSETLGLDANTYARVTVYADGRKFITVYRRGTGDGSPDSDQVVSSRQTIDMDQAKSWRELNPQDKPAQTPARTPEAAANDARLNAERERNAALPPDQDPRWETDAERATRARQTVLDQQAAADRTAQQAERERTAARQTAADERAAAAQEAANARADRSFDLQQQQANRPQIVSAPTNTPNIAQMGPGGEITSVPNPNYDAAAAEAARMKEQLSLQIQLGQLNAQQASAQYDRWWKEQILLPNMQAQEARARAEEIRQAQRLEDERQRHAADFTRQRETTALSYGQQRASQELQMLPYMVGDEYPEQIATAINAVARADPSMINFTGEAFEFEAPDLDSIAQKATAQALQNISPLAKAMAEGGSRPLQVADYSGVNPMAATAPPESADMDLDALYAMLGSE